MGRCFSRTGETEPSCRLTEELNPVIYWEDGRFNVNGVTSQVSFILRQQECNGTVKTLRATDSRANANCEQLAQG